MVSRLNRKNKATEFITLEANCDFVFLVTSSEQLVITNIAVINDHASFFMGSMLSSILQNKPAQQLLAVLLRHQATWHMSWETKQ